MRLNKLKMYKTQEVVIKELKEIFKVDDNIGKGTTESDGKFYVNKQHLERFEVLEKLQNYFNGVGVKDGYVTVSPITMVFTSFEVCNGAPS